MCISLINGVRMEHPQGKAPVCSFQGWFLHLLQCALLLAVHWIPRVHYLVLIYSELWGQILWYFTWLPKAELLYSGEECIMALAWLDWVTFHSVGNLHVSTFCLTRADHSSIITVHAFLKATALRRISWQMVLATFWDYPASHDW